MYPISLPDISINTKMEFIIFPLNPLSPPIFFTWRGNSTHMSPSQKFWNSLGISYLSSLYPATHDSVSRRPLSSSFDTTASVTCVVQTFTMVHVVFHNSSFLHFTKIMFIISPLKLFQWHPIVYHIKFKLSLSLLEQTEYRVLLYLRLLTSWVSLLLPLLTLCRSYPWVPTTSHLELLHRPFWIENCLPANLQNWAKASPPDRLLSFLLQTLLIWGPL